MRIGLADGGPAGRGRHRAGADPRRGRDHRRTPPADGPGAIDDDGWLDTGDLGYLDADGYLFLVGRSDDVINRGGEKIYPREIEEILLAQPGVRSAAVIGAAWTRCSASGRSPTSSPTPRSRTRLRRVLRAACAEKLPRHKQPSEFWLVDEMPLGPTGKISRRLLKESVAARP